MTKDFGFFFSLLWPFQSSLPAEAVEGDCRGEVLENRIACSSWKDVFQGFAGGHWCLGGARPVRQGGPRFRGMSQVAAWGRAVRSLFDFLDGGDSARRRRRPSSVAGWWMK